LNFYFRPLRWLRRFRKRCGYNIHSPFAFNFVTGVIYEAGRFYAYSALESQGVNVPKRARLKDDRLVFRVVNFAEPKRIVAVGPDAEAFRHTCDYIRAARNCPLCVNPRIDELKATPPDFLYTDCEDWKAHVDHFLPHIHDRSALLIKGIYRSKASLQSWKQLVAQPEVRVSFDLYDFGICFFEKRLNKEHFVINYY
jgi:hypothetical protein